MTELENSIKVLMEHTQHYVPTEDLEHLYAVIEAAGKLAEYETVEEEGRLVVLPSNQVLESQGDIVYYIYDYEIIECENCGISIWPDGKAWISLAADEDIFPYREPIAEFDTDPTDWCKKTIDVLVSEWGKTVFLTHEEAEKALREMEENDCHH